MFLYYRIIILLYSPPLYDSFGDKYIIIIIIVSINEFYQSEVVVHFLFIYFSFQIITMMDCMIGLIYWLIEHHMNYWILKTKTQTNKKWTIIIITTKYYYYYYYKKNMLMMIKKITMIFTILILFCLLLLIWFDQYNPSINQHNGSS